MNKKYVKIVAACVLIPFTATAQQSQVCNGAVSHNTPTHRFEVLPGGVAVDQRTGLTWMRCPLGYAIEDAGTPDDYGDDACRADGGTANMNWQAALEAAAVVNDAGGFAGFTGWRIPNIKELVSVVERRCIGPALNTAVFPAVRFDKFWTSSTYERLGEAAYVEFIYGNNDSSTKDREFQVRLVR